MTSPFPSIIYYCQKLPQQRKKNTHTHTHKGGAFNFTRFFKVSYLVLAPNCAHSETAELPLHYQQKIFNHKFLYETSVPICWDLESMIPLTN